MASYPECLSTSSYFVYCVYIQVRFHSSEETLMVYNNYSSPSSSYIQISPINTLPAQVTLHMYLVALLMCAYKLFY